MAPKACKWLGPFAQRVARQRREKRVTFDGARAKWRVWHEFDARPIEEQMKIRFIGGRVNCADSPHIIDDDHYIAVGNRIWREAPMLATYILREYVE